MRACYTRRPEILSGNDVTILQFLHRESVNAKTSQGLIEQEATEITEVTSPFPKCLLVEAKAVEGVVPIHKAQLLSYMKLLDIPLGLIVNFHTLKLTDGVSRLILPGTEATLSESAE